MSSQQLGELLLETVKVVDQLTKKVVEMDNRIKELESNGS
jgi:hypothetical protein